MKQSKKLTPVVKQIRQNLTLQALAEHLNRWPFPEEVAKISKKEYEYKFREDFLVKEYVFFADKLIGRLTIKSQFGTHKILHKFTPLKTVPKSK